MDTCNYGFSAELIGIQIGRIGAVPNWGPHFYFEYRRNAVSASPEDKSRALLLPARTDRNHRFGRSCAAERQHEFLARAATDRNIRKKVQSDWRRGRTYMFRGKKATETKRKKLSPEEYPLASAGSGGRRAMTQLVHLLRSKLLNQR